LDEARCGTLQRQEYSLLWRIHRAAGYAHRHCQHDEQAAHEFALAREAIASLAMTIDYPVMRKQFTEAALVSLPDIRQAKAKQRATGGEHALTRREREVARLIAQEKFNREIADALVISERTVESHVANIMFKLKCSSRKQVALWVRERELNSSEC
jgi:non-specific serine/threonine protein kinase